MVDLWICGYLLLVCAAIRALKGWWAIERDHFVDHVAHRRAVDLAGLLMLQACTRGSLGFIFTHPPEVRKRKRKEKPVRECNTRAIWLHEIWLAHSQGVVLISATFRVRNAVVRDASVMYASTYC